VDCILISGEGNGLPAGVSRGVAGEETTLASKAEALVGLAVVPDAESLRDAMGTSVVRHGEETVEGVSGGRRLQDRERAGASVGRE